MSEDRPSALPSPDRALLAYLLAEEVLTAEALLPVLRRVVEDAAPLGEVLVHAGLLDSQTVDNLRAQAVRHIDGVTSIGAPASLDAWIDAAHGFDDRDARADTLYDVPTRGPPARAGGAAAGLVLEDSFIDDPPDPDWDDDLGPTSPNVPASAGTSAPWPTQLPVPARAPSGIDIDVTRPSPAASALSPEGRTPDQRYRLLRELGRGGMGRILAARDVEIGREVAVKVLLPGLEAEGLAIRRFWTEVQATGQLEHPGIIPVHDVGRLPSGELFYVMKKLTGRTLADILEGLRRGDGATKEEFTRVRLLTIFQQIAYAVAFAHAHGVIHRDIKPGNIMVGRYGEAILIDWGLAKVLGEDDPAVNAVNDDMTRVAVLPRSTAETATGTITGTPQYISPEATEGDPTRIDSRSDVYGLGAVLYEILCYVPAYEDLGFVPTVMKVRDGKFDPPRQRRPSAHIPEELEELCLVAMSKDPDARPTAKALADDVGRILEGARERERRQREARERVREGRQAADRWKMLRLELQRAESEAKRLRKDVPSWASIAEKRSIWALEDRVSELKTEAVSAFEEAEAAFLRALGEVSDDHDARSALVSLYYKRFGEAERTRDHEGQRYYRQLVLRYDDGSWARTIEGNGSLRIDGPPGLDVRIAPLREKDRVSTPGPERELGITPIEAFELAMGSYVVTFGPPGKPPQRIPVRVGRAEDVQVDLRYRDPREVGEGFVLVPAGVAIIGGDPIAHGSLERREVHVEEFCIARFPVTCAEYAAFLDDLAQASLEEAFRHVPRARAQEGYYWTWDSEARRFRLPETTPGGHRWTAQLPVNGVSAKDASAYIEWRRRKTGEQVRLPKEIEWEKAARGVDGRFFPWGDEFDPIFCKMKDSRDASVLEPEPVGAFPTDCSVYGARDMAGGVREICWTEHDGAFAPVMRGGCWHDSGLFCRLAFRHPTRSDLVNTGLGFRLAKDLD